MKGRGRVSSRKFKGCALQKMANTLRIIGGEWRGRRTALPGNRRQSGRLPTGSATPSSTGCRCTCRADAAWTCTRAAARSGSRRCRAGRRETVFVDADAAAARQPGANATNAAPRARDSPARWMPRPISRSPPDPLTSCSSIRRSRSAPCPGVQMLESRGWLRPARSSTSRTPPRPARRSCRTAGRPSFRARRARSGYHLARRQEQRTSEGTWAASNVSGHFRPVHQRAPGPRAPGGGIFDRSSWPSPPTRARRRSSRSSSASNWRGSAVRPAERRGHRLLGPDGRVRPPERAERDDAGPARGLRLRVRVPARHDEPASDRQGRDRVPDADRAVQLHLLDADPRDRLSRRRRSQFVHPRSRTRSRRASDVSAWQCGHQ